MTGRTQPGVDRLTLHMLVEQSDGRILLLTSGELRSRNVSGVWQQPRGSHTRHAALTGE